MAELDINRIRDLLPHRYPFLLIDRVVDYTVGESLQALKNVTANEPFFQGHFPQRPVFPGVLILEAMAQAAALLASLTEDAEASTETLYLFAGIDKARFKRQVEPGDQLILHATMKRKVRKIWICSVEARVDDELCSSAELMFTYQHI